MDTSISKKKTKESYETRIREIFQKKEKEKTTFEEKIDVAPINIDSIVKKWG